jgi:uncharacterized protein (UPF0332 family)
MKEIELLVKRADRAILSARILINEGDFEASVSRSYYGMFYITEALLLTKGLKFSSHKSVILLFSENFIKTGIFKTEFGRWLSKAFESRLLGDYSFEHTADKNKAEQVFTWADGFVKEVKDYLMKEGYL